MLYFLLPLTTEWIVVFFLILRKSWYLQKVNISDSFFKSTFSEHGLLWHRNLIFRNMSLKRKTNKRYSIKQTQQTVSSTEQATRLKLLTKHMPQNMKREHYEIYITVPFIAFAIDVPTCTRQANSCQPCSVNRW